MSTPKTRPMHSSRRRFLLGAASLGAGAFTVAALGRMGTRRRLVRRSLPLMGTLAEVVVVPGRGLHADDAQPALDAAFHELQNTERLMSRFSATSDVGRVNQAAGQATRIDARTHFVVSEAQRWAESTDGRFDPCLGRLEELWDVTHRQVPPSAAEIAAASPRDAWLSLQLGTADLTLAADAKLDLGGIAKGFAIDEARRALEAAGVRDALINVGGDLFAMGLSEDGDAWQVGVRDPLDPTQLSSTLEVHDLAVATSGDYERCFDYKGQRYHHILGPDGRPVTRPGRHSLTISAPTCMVADAAATAGFGLDRSDASALIARVDSGACVRA